MSYFFPSGSLMIFIFCVYFTIQGCLKPISVFIPPGSLLDASETAAVVGGNVLTSQRLVDVVLKAFQVCAASQVNTRVSSIIVIFNIFYYLKNKLHPAGLAFQLEPPFLAFRNTSDSWKEGNPRIGGPKGIEKQIHAVTLSHVRSIVLAVDIMGSQMNIRRLSSSHTQFWRIFEGLRIIITLSISWIQQFNQFSRFILSCRVVWTMWRSVTKLSGTMRPLLAELEPWVNKNIIIIHFDNVTLFHTQLGFNVCPKFNASTNLCSMPIPAWNQVNPCPASYIILKSPSFCHYTPPHNLQVSTSWHSIFHILVLKMPRPFQSAPTHQISQDALDTSSV